MLVKLALHGFLRASEAFFQLLLYLAELLQTFFYRWQALLS
jgi:hypothetical protein